MADSENLNDIKTIRCDERDPNRCQQVIQTGQCPYLSMTGFKYCKMHNANSVNHSEKKKLHDYLLGEYQERLDQFAGSANIKNLHGEVGILRMTLEKIYTQIKDPSQFPLYADKLVNLADKIHKIVNDVQRMDEKTGQMMNKDTVLIIADTIMTIISKYITDADIRELLSMEISDAIIAVGSGTTVQKRS